MIFAEIDREARERGVPPVSANSRIGSVHCRKRSGCMGADRRRSPDPLRSRESAERIIKQHKLNPDDAHLLSRIPKSTEVLAGASGDQ